MYYKTHVYDSRRGIRNAAVMQICKDDRYTVGIIEHLNFLVSS